MAAVWMRLRAELRRRWRSWIGLALLAGLGGGLVTAAAAGARRTDSAYPRLLAASAPYHAFVYQYTDFSETEIDPAAIESLPEVASAARLNWMWLGLEEASPFGLAIPADVRLGSDINRHRILHGREADPTNAREVTVSYAGSEEYALPLGKRIPLLQENVSRDPTYQGFLDNALAAGVPMELEVVGIQVGPGDLPPITIGSSVVLYGTPALYAAQSKAGGVQSQIDSVAVRLDRGTADIDSFVDGLRRLAGTEEVHPTLQTNTTASIERAISPLTTAMWLVAGLLAIATVLVLGQAVSRQVWLSSDDAETLGALGMTPTQQWTTAIGKALVIGLAAAAIAVVVALGLSPLTPIGTARFAEPSPGVRLDPAALGVAAGATVAALLILAAVPARRATKSALRRSRAAEGKASATAGALAHAGASTSLVAGAHLALAPGHGRTSLPVRSTTLGVALAVAALAAALGVGASFDHLLSTPRLYGTTWDLQITDYGGGENEETPRSDEVIRRLSADPEISETSVGTKAQIELNGRIVEAIALTSLRGTTYPTIVTGRPPQDGTEIVLGTRTMRALDVRVGDRVQVRLADPERRDMRVVGQAVLPALTSGPLGETPWLDWESIRSSLPPSEREPNMLLLRFVPGANVAALKDRIEKIVIPPEELEFSSIEDVIIPNETPADVVNFGRVEDLPVAVSGALAALAAAVLAHMVMSSVRRRRRDVAIFKTLGLGTSGVRAAIAWQASMLVCAAMIVGIPLGIAGGRWAWRALADNVGVMPEPRAPVALIALIVPAAVLLANLVAALPGRIAARTQPAKVLRAE